jgi:general secretion pathway protein K
MSKNKKGFALSIVLWIVLILLGATSFIIHLAKEMLNNARDVENKLLSRLEAESIYEQMKFLILVSKNNGDTYIPLIKLPQNSLYHYPEKIKANGYEYGLNRNSRIHIKDTSGMINVFYAPASWLAGTFWSMSDRELRYVMIDSVKDWRDQDNIPRLNGAEFAYYKLKNKQLYGPRNMDAIQDVSELRLIRGFRNMNSEKWKKVVQNLYYGRTSEINLLLQPKGMLIHLLGVTPVYADQLIQLRNEDKKEFQKIVKMLPLFDDEYMGFYLSREVLLDISVQKGNAKSNIKALLVFNLKKEKPFTVISMEFQ